jgi:hypothetical protein
MKTRQRHVTSDGARARRRRNRRKVVSLSLRASPLRLMPKLSLPSNLGNARASGRKRANGFGHVKTGIYPGRGTICLIFLLHYIKLNDIISVIEVIWNVAEYFMLFTCFSPL